MKLQRKDQFEQNMESFAGQKGFRVFARFAIAEQRRTKAVLPRKMEHVARIGAETGAFGEDPTDGAGKVSDGLCNDDPEEISGRDRFTGDFASNPDHQPSGGSAT